MFTIQAAIAEPPTQKWNITLDRSHRRWTGKKPKSSSGEVWTSLAKKEAAKKKKESKIEKVSRLPESSTGHAETTSGNYIVTVEGKAYNVTVENSRKTGSPHRSNPVETPRSGGEIEILAQTPGNIVQIMVAVGDHAEKGISS